MAQLSLEEACNDLTARSRYSACEEYAHQLYPLVEPMLRVGWIRSDLVAEWEILANMMMAKIKELEMEVAELECEVAETKTFFAGCTPTLLPPEAQEESIRRWDAAEYATRHLRDESRDEQPPFASKTPAGIETGL